MCWSKILMLKQTTNVIIHECLIYTNGPKKQPSFMLNMTKAKEVAQVLQFAENNSLVQLFLCANVN